MHVHIYVYVYNTYAHIYIVYMIVGFDLETSALIKKNINVLLLFILRLY